MDGSTFDHLTRTLTAAGSRRRTLGGVLAGTLGLLGARVEERPPRRKSPVRPVRSARRANARRCFLMAPPVPAEHARAGAVASP